MPKRPVVHALTTLAAADQFTEMEHTFQRSGGYGEQQRRNVEKGGNEEGTSQVLAIWVDIILYWGE
jgi:hypothetical protein